LKACISEKDLFVKMCYLHTSIDKSFQGLYMYIELKELSLTLACQKCNWTV